LQDLALATVPGFSFRKLFAKVMQVDNILLFGHKPRSEGP